MEEGEEDGARDGDSKIGQDDDISLPVTEQVNAVSNTSIEPVVVATGTVRACLPLITCVLLSIPNILR